MFAKISKHYGIFNNFSRTHFRSLALCILVSTILLLTDLVLFTLDYITVIGVCVGSIAIIATYITVLWSNYIEPGAETLTQKETQFYRFAEFGRLSSSLLHDLANPLTSVSMNLQELETSQNKAIVGEAREGLSCIERYVVSARNQLSAESPKVYFDTKIESEKVGAFLQSKAKVNNVKLEFNMQKNLQIYGECTKFSRLMSNLIANAIDSYGHEKSGPKIVYICSLTKNSNAHFSIKDAGVGILKEDLGKIFQPFFTTKEHERGTGIGLTFTKLNIEEDFRGQLLVKSKPGETIFTAVIPLSKTQKLSAKLIS